MTINYKYLHLWAGRLPTYYHFEYLHQNFHEKDGDYLEGGHELNGQCRDGGQIFHEKDGDYLEGGHELNGHVRLMHMLLLSE